MTAGWPASGSWASLSLDTREYSPELDMTGAGGDILDLPIRTTPPHSE